MKTAPVRKSNITYIGNLTKASYEGFTSAIRERDRRANSLTLTPAVLVPAAIGAVLGILAARLRDRNQSGYGMALGGLAGTALGLGAGLGFETRASTRAMLRSTLHRVNGVRNARWLERNPITYA